VPAVDLPDAVRSLAVPARGYRRCSTAARTLSMSPIEGGPSPAVRAVQRAIRQAGLDSMERYAATGLAPREPIVSGRVRDPSERPGPRAERSRPDLV
jgi:hypothetical protein